MASTEIPSPRPERDSEDGPAGGGRPGCDWLFRGGVVVDGDGGPRRRADVAVVGDRVAAIGNLSDWRGEHELDVRGRIVAPGFIDAHTHDDRAVLVTPEMAAKVSQGVTTVVAGNCGVSLAPLPEGTAVPPLNLLGDTGDFFASSRDYAESLRTRPAAVNVAVQVGHSTLRAATMERLDRAATDTELARMGELLDAAMQAGCIGLSTGLAYPPAHAAPTAEVVALLSRVARFGGMHTTHMRDERAGVVDSVRETIAIGRRAGVPVVISHHKCSGRANWGLSAETLPLIAEARATQAVDLDVYPYTASSTVLLPDFVRSAERVLITWSRAVPAAAGRDLHELCREWGCALDDGIARLQPAGAIYFQMDESDLERIIKFSNAMIGSDGIPHDEVPHPRLWGTFPRVLGHYCRERGWLTLEEAVARMSGVPARVFGLAGRGRLAPGTFADIVVFEAERIIDCATYDAPTAPSAGIGLVMANGIPTWREGGVTGSRPGRLLVRERGP